MSGSVKGLYKELVVGAGLEHAPRHLDRHVQPSEVEAARGQSLGRRHLPALLLHLHLCICSISTSAPSRRSISPASRCAASIARRSRRSSGSRDSRRKRATSAVERGALAVVLARRKRSKLRPPMRASRKVVGSAWAEAVVRVGVGG